MGDSDNKNNKKHTPEEYRLIKAGRILVTENATLATKLTIASAFQSMWIKAYDALLHHGINMRDLPEYHDNAALERALEVGIETEGGSRVLDYIKRVANAIDARVRRKGFREV